MDQSLGENKIVFTQDVPGERAWLQTQFPEYSNLETASSGKWPTEFPENSNQQHLYEIAYSDHHDLDALLNSKVSKIKSFYHSHPSAVFDDNIHWVCADQFVSKATYQLFADQPKFWALHIARSGTVFIETLLSQYKVKGQIHAGTGSHAHLMQLYETAKSNPDTAIVFVYRPELWETLTSTVIAQRYGAHHGNDFDWASADPITITVEDMLQFQTVMISTLNFWCNLRCLLPTHSMLLLNGSEIIHKYRHQVNHRQVGYNKQTLVKNYTDAKNQWDSMFNQRLTKMLDNAVAHLDKMRCKRNLDHLSDCV